MSVTGRADGELVFTRDGKRLVDSRSTAELRAAQGLTPQVVPRNQFAEVVCARQATQALQQMGFKPHEAKRAVEAACSRAGLDAGLNTLVKEALARTRDD